MENIVENIKLEPKTLFTPAKLEYYSGYKDDCGYTDAFKVTYLKKKRHSMYKSAGSYIVY